MIAYENSAEPTWPTSAASHQTAAPSRRMTTAATNAANRICQTGSGPSTAIPLLSRASTCPSARSSALESIPEALRSPERSRIVNTITAAK
jgi:hypothetical protein